MTQKQAPPPSGIPQHPQLAGGGGGDRDAGVTCAHFRNERAKRNWQVAGGLPEKGSNYLYSTSLCHPSTHTHSRNQSVPTDGYQSLIVVELIWQWNNDGFRLKTNNYPYSLREITTAVEDVMAAVAAAQKNREMFAIKKSYSIEVCKIIITIVTLTFII